MDRGLQGGAGVSLAVLTADPARRIASVRSRLALPAGALGVVVGVLLPWRAAMHTGVFDDTFWHRAAGVWMLNHHVVMRHDVFSYTVTGRSWITPEWGYGVLLAASIRLFGPVAFWLLSAGVASLAVLCVAVHARMRGAGWIWSGLLCVEAGAAITLFLDDRPQVVSYFFVALLLLGLAYARRRPGVLWAVPLLFVCWANLHGSFLLGLAVLGLELVTAWRPLRLGRVEAADPLSPRTAGLAMTGAVLGTLLNPFGPRVYQSAFGVTFNPVVSRFIGEWQSPDFHDPAVLAVVVLPVVVTVAWLVLSDASVAGGELLLAGLLLVATLDAARFMPYFAIAWCALAASCRPVQERMRPNLLVWPLGAVLALAMLQGPWSPPGQPAKSVPVGAVSYLETHPGRVFSTYLWNDYLDWKGIPVFIDGRTELYTGTPVFDEYLAVDNLTVDPDTVLLRYGVRYVLWQPKTALSVYLSHDPSWRLVRRTQLSSLFERTGGMGR
jgi:hypothetical protein